MLVAIPSESFISMSELSRTSPSRVRKSNLKSLAKKGLGMVKGWMIVQLS